MDDPRDVSLPLRPDCTIRESARAAHVRLKVSVPDGLVVVVPAGFDRRRIPGLLREKRDWVERALEWIEAQRAALPDGNERPETIALPAIGRSWRIDWRATAGGGAELIEVGPSGLRVSGAIEDPTAWRPALRRWLIGQGREHLIPRAEGTAKELGVSVARVSIRCQKTRWGSYTARAGRAGTVSLNAQLLFFPERLARFVVLHELCHAVHPDHSPAFWNLVRSHEPETGRLRRELRTAWRCVPGWVTRSS